MLSLFPSLLSFERISPLLIRLALGAIFIYTAYRAYFQGKSSVKNKSIGLIEGVSGILLVIGLWTQLAALVAFVDLVIRIIGKIRTRTFLSNGINYYLLMLIMAISLLVTGAGFLAFDLPL